MMHQAGRIAVICVWMVMLGLTSCRPQTDAELQARLDAARDRESAVNERLRELQDDLARLDRQLNQIRDEHDRSMHEAGELSRRLHRNLMDLRREISEGETVTPHAPAAPPPDTEAADEGRATGPLGRLLVLIVLLAAVFLLLKFFTRWFEPEEEIAETGSSGRLPPASYQTEEGTIHLSPEVRNADPRMFNGPPGEEGEPEEGEPEEHKEP